MTDPKTDLRDRIRRVLAQSDGFDFDSLEPHDYQIQAAAIAAVLPPPADRAAVLLEAAERLRALAEHAQHGVWVGMRAAADELRRLAAEAQQQGHRRVKGRVVAVTKSPALLGTPDDEIAALAAAEAQPEGRSDVGTEFVRQIDSAQDDISRAHAEGEHAFCGDECDDTDLTETDIDRMMAAGIPVRIVTAPPDTHGAVAQRQPDTETPADEVALLRLTLDAIEEGRRELRAENSRLRSQIWTLAAVFEGFGRLLASSSRDWGQYAADAWLYAVILGWDCEQPVHDETCTHGAMEEMTERHGWDAATVAKARRYRAVVHTLTAPAVPVQPAADGPRTVCVCGHTRGEHARVSGRLLCDECDGLSPDACKEFEAP